LIPSLKKAYAEFARHPFVFIWISLVYLSFQTLFALAAAGLFLIYFLLASVLGMPTGLDALATKAALGIIAIVFLFFSCGLNAGLANGYSLALERKKANALDFLRYSLGRAPVMFLIMLIRELIFLFTGGVLIGAYVYFNLGDYEFLDVLFGGTVFLIVFFLHMMFTPAFIYAGAFGNSLFDSMRNGYKLLRRKHFMFVGLYFVFAIAWVLGFIPFIQLGMLFALYPIVYSAMLVMALSSGKGRAGSGHTMKLGAFIEPEEKQEDDDTE